MTIMQTYFECCTRLSVHVELCFKRLSSEKRPSLHYTLRKILPLQCNKLDKNVLIYIQKKVLRTAESESPMTCNLICEGS